MEIRRLSAVLLILFLLVAAFPLALANEQDTVHQPVDETTKYIATDEISAKLSISDSGTATCIGFVRAKSASSTCSVTTKLMHKVCDKWKLLDSWHNSGSGANGVKAKGIHKVSAGTYKVVVSAIVTTANGDIELISKSTRVKTYE